MAKIVLIAILIIALIVGVGSVVFYNSQSYEYNLKLKDTISASEIYTKTSPAYYVGPLNSNASMNINSFSVNLGEMNFENKGYMEQVIEFPKLAVCLELKENNINYAGNLNYAFWTIYTIYLPDLNKSSDIYQYSGSKTEIYSQNIGGYSYGNPSVEINAGETLTYYISLKNAYVNLIGTNSEVFKGAKLKVYDLHKKELNPLSNELDIYGGYNDYSCSTIGGKFEPVKIIEVV